MLNKRHARWMTYIETFSYVLRYKHCGNENIIADALFGRYVFLTSLIAKMLGFEFVKNVYAYIYISCDKAVIDKFYKHDWYFFKENKLRLNNCPMSELLIREAHSGD